MLANIPHKSMEFIRIYIKIIWWEKTFIHFRINEKMILQKLKNVIHFWDIRTILSEFEILIQLQNIC